MFHGVPFDELEEETGLSDADMKKNFMEQKVRSLILTQFNIECYDKFKHVFRFEIPVVNDKYIGTYTTLGGMTARS